MYFERLKSNSAKKVLFIVKDILLLKVLSFIESIGVLYHQLLKSIFTKNYNCDWKYTRMLIILF